MGVSVLRGLAVLGFAGATRPNRRALTPRSKRTPAIRSGRSTRTGALSSFFDASQRRFLWVGNVVHPERGVEPLVYDSECWDGPAELPSSDALPPGVPTRRCAGLVQSFAASVRANGAKARD